MTPETKPIKGYPGYSITKDGQVYSIRNIQNGQPKLIKAKRSGNILLCRGAYDRKQFKIQNLLQQTWGEAHES